MHYRWSVSEEGAVQTEMAAGLCIDNSLSRTHSLKCPLVSNLWQPFLDDFFFLLTRIVFFVEELLTFDDTPF